jgi:hypothetical protein
MSSTTVTRAYLDHKLALAKRCSRGKDRLIQSLVQYTQVVPIIDLILAMAFYVFFTEATLAGAKAAAVATVASAVPTVSISIRAFLLLSISLLHSGALLLIEMY